MLASTIELYQTMPTSPTTGPTSSFTEVNQDATGSVRIDEDTTLLTPRYLTLRHSNSKPKGGLFVLDRHLIQVAETRLNSSDAPEVASVNLTFNLPRTPTFDRNALKTLLAFAYGLTLSDDILDSLLRNER